MEISVIDINGESLITSSFYRPQTKFAKVMFSQVSVCPSGGGVHGRGTCVVVGGVHGRGHAWLGGRAWQGGMCGGRGEHAWQGGMCVCGGACMAGWACMARGACVVEEGSMHGRGVCVCVCGGGGMCGRRDSHCSGQYASYWNAFLLISEARVPNP